MAIYNYEVESHCLSGLLRHPRIFPQIEFIVNENDFVSKLYKSIFSVIKSTVHKGGELDAVLIAERLNNLKIVTNEYQGDDYQDLLESLKLVQISESGTIETFKKLKAITVRRTIDETAIRISQSMHKNTDASIEELISMADALYSEKISLFDTENDFADIYESLEREIEERGNNPLIEVGFKGPFPKMHELFGSLHRPGNITLVGARTGVGKTSLGFAYNTYIQETYNVPLLHLDNGEMSIEELQYRAICMFTGGEVPYHFLESGQWRLDPKMEKLVRAAWPRVKKLIGKTFYYDTSSMTPKEIFSLVRRFQLSKVGANKDFITHYDYLKPFDTTDRNTPEWAQMGHFMKDTKSFIKKLKIPWWTSLQLNKSGITTNKKVKDVDDSEGSLSTSDRIVQQVSHAIIFRRKLMVEMAVEHGLGNSRAHFVKNRHLGQNVHDALTPVRMPSGRLCQNYFHFMASSFAFTELGDLASTAHTMGDFPVVDDTQGKTPDETI